MKERQAFRGRRPGNRARGLAVDDKGCGFLSLGLIHRRPGGGIDHQIAVKARNLRRAGRRVSLVSLRAGEKHRLRQTGAKLLRQLSCGAKNQRLHAMVPRRWPTPARSCKGRHQASLSRYHCTVRASPSSTVTEGRQPSSSRMREGSIA